MSGTQEDDGWDHSLMEQEIQIDPDLKMELGNEMKLSALERTVVVNDFISFFDIREYNPENVLLPVSKLLCVNQTIEKLCCENIGLTQETVGEIATSLAYNTKIKTLCLKGNHLRDAGVQKLSQGLLRNTSVQEVDLANNEISDRGLEWVAAFVQKSSSIRVLNLARNPITNYSASILAFALENTSSLRCLDISSILWTREGLTKVSNALLQISSLELLNLSNNKIMKDAGVKQISALLSENKSIKEIDLSNCKIKSWDYAGENPGLRGNTTLVSANFSYNSLGGEGLEYIVEFVACNPCLQYLNLEANDIQERGAVILSRALTIHKSIKSLNLARNFIGDKGVTTLLQALTGNPNITILNFDLNEIGYTGARALSHFLYSTFSLSELNIARNEIRDEGLDLILEALKSLKYSAVMAAFQGQAVDQGATSFSLTLSSNLIRTKGAQSISEFLSLDTGLHSLSLANNSLHDEGVSLFSPSLSRSNTTLRVLNLSFCKIEDKGLIELSSAILKNKYLKELVLEGNRFGLLGVQALAVALSKNRTLKCLDISSCKILDNGMAVLCNVLAYSTVPVISFLSVANCGLESQGLAWAAQMIIHSHTLRVLKLHGNQYWKNGVFALSEALKNVRNLEKLFINTRPSIKEKYFLLLKSRRRNGLQIIEEIQLNQLLCLYI